MFNRKKVFATGFILLAGMASFLYFSSSVLATTTVNVQMSVPSANVCGNSVIEGSEQCDDGNLVGGDGCSAVCATESGGGSDNPPAISSVITSTQSTSAVISWSASDDYGIVTSSLVFGITTAYGTDGAVSGSYSSSIVGLTPSTEYFFRISAIDTGGQSVGYSGNFLTLAETQAPIISNILVIPGINTADVSWQTDEVADSQINYGLTSQYGNTTSNGALVLSHNIQLLNLLPNTTYHYRIVSTDPMGNSAFTPDAIFKTLKDDVSPPDVSNFLATPDGNSIRLTWNNPPLLGTPDFSGVRIVRKIGGSSANISDGLLVYTGAGELFVDSNVQREVNYFYTAFSFDTSLNYSAGVFDDAQLGASGGQSEICGNGLDDDSNGLVDCADPACSSNSDCHSSGGGSDQEIDSTNLLYYVGNGLIRVYPTYQTNQSTHAMFMVDDVWAAGDLGTVLGLAGTDLTVGVPKDILIGDVQKMTLAINGGEHQFAFDNVMETYFAKVYFPDVGENDAVLHVLYTNGSTAFSNFVIKSLPHGVVRDADDKPISGVIISIVNSLGERFDAERYGEQNPQLTNSNGFYGWVVPNDIYVIRAEKDGYLAREVGPLGPSNHVINSNLTLHVVPPKILENVDGDKTVGENVAIVGKNILKNGGLGLQIVEDLKEDPKVQDFASNVVAPVVTSLVAVGLLSLVPWAALLNLLQFLFLQPLMLLGRRKREKWGIVYNSLNKLPIDLATVRLLNATTGKIVQSRVTDAEGRYVFIAEPGKYRISVYKSGLVFPSAVLKNYKEDVEKVDLYHGEIIDVSEADTQIAANIPLDPIGATKTPFSLFFHKFQQRLYIAMSLVGFLATLFTLYLAPRWYVWLLLGVHVSAFLLFLRLTKVKKPKGWGIVYDAKSKKPIGRVIARLFDSQFNKLVDTKLTDRKGRYSFLVGGNKYYVTYDCKGYEHNETDVIDLTKDKSGVVAKDVWMKVKVV